MTDRIAVLHHKIYPIDSVRARREIEALLASGYEVDLICCHQTGQRYREVQGNLRIFRMPVDHKRKGKFHYLVEYATFFVFALLTLSWLQVFRQYRLVQVENIPDVLVFAALLPRLQGARVLLDIQDPMPETFRYKYGLSNDNRWIKLICWVERVSVNFADYVLTVHEPLKHTLIQRGCPPDRISVIMNLPDDRFHAAADVVWPRSLPPNLTIIYAGTLEARNGVQTAVRGFALLLRNIPGLRLRVVGNGEYVNDLKQLANSLGIGSAVSMEPAVPLEEIPALLGQSDVGISLQEGLFGELAFPMKVPEYMAMGLPAIVSATSVTRTYFTEDTVAFITPGDEVAFACQVRRLCLEPDYGRRFIANGRRFLERWNWATEKQRYLEIVSHLLSR
jgi:glycosyltransferase involved in cell wall biosynthesis